jgi:hypothetical protein
MRKVMHKVMHKVAQTAPGDCTHTTSPLGECVQCVRFVQIEAVCNGGKR